MYRQSHPSFGKPSYRVNSLPENYSGNAFSPEIKEKEADSAEKNTALPVAKEHREDSDAGEKKEKRESPSLPLPFAGLSIATDTAILFLVLLVLAAGGGEKDDGALLMILILLLL
ncbi:MAG: hypothetical protein E7601_02230 [Ruminococcaceae bacterium]|nr:hypothetical protein [Oscillospiraceae bacterium]